MRTPTDSAARARISAWPGRDGVAHVALVDHNMVPSAADIERWRAEAAASGATTARTSALFPAAAEAFDLSGFTTADELTLLQLDLTKDSTEAERRAATVRTRRMRRSDLGAAADVDRLAFAGTWSNDASSLDAIRRATPQHRSRVVVDGDHVRAFSISGRAGTSGYVQRLAVHPGDRRRGVASALLADALSWLRRRSARSVLVNTAVDNDPALCLYRSFGFTVLDTPLRVMESPLGT